MVKEGHPELSFLRFDPFLMLERLRRELPGLSDQHQVDFVLKRHATLACMRTRHRTSVVLVHSILNHQDTPAEVIEFVLRHELLHLVIPAREVHGKLTKHPPEFWEAEKRISPNKPIAWAWLLLVLGLSLKVDAKRECIFIRRGWEKLMSNPRPNLNEVAT